MRGRMIVGVVIVFGALGAWITLALRDEPIAARLSEPDAPPAVDPSGHQNPAPASSVDRLLEAGPLQKTLHDRQVRDELRRRILAAWTQSPDEEVRAAAKDGRFVPIPEDQDASRAYLQSVVREDFVPMAKQCYEELLVRNKHAGGKIMLKVKIVGDEKIGGVIEDAQVEAEGGLDDPELLTCMRESFMSLSFRPPSSGYLTVHYPLTFASDEEPDR